MYKRQRLRYQYSNLTFVSLICAIWIYNGSSGGKTPGCQDDGGTMADGTRLSSRCGSYRLVPVSYTHLDVYKRQGVTSMLLARAFPIEKYLNFTSHLLNLSLMMLILIFVVGLRIWMGRGEGMHEIVADKTPRKVYCFPEYVKNILLPLIYVTFLIVMFIAVCYAILINFEPNFIIHFGLLISSFLFFISGNLIFYSPIISFKAKVK